MSRPSFCGPAASRDHTSLLLTSPHPYRILAFYLRSKVTPSFTPEIRAKHDLGLTRLNRADITRALKYFGVVNCMPRPDFAVLKSPLQQQSEKLSCEVANLRERSRRKEQVLRIYILADLITRIVYLLRDHFNTSNMSHNAKDALPPSYSESANHAQPSLCSSNLPQTSRGQALLDQLTLTRTNHIQSIITTHILPLIETQASFGIAQTTIAMLPSDIPLPAIEEKSEFSFDTFGTTKPVEVIGFSSEEEPKVVRLEGQMNSTEFWRVQAVIGELERVLREILNASAYLRGPTRPRVGGSEFEEVVGRQSRRYLWSRMIPLMGPEQKSASGNPEVGTRQIDSAGLVLVKARLEEICLRTVNDFGLYDTMSKQCVIVRVDARC